MNKIRLASLMALGIATGLGSCSKVTEAPAPKAGTHVQNRVPAEPPCGAYIGVDCPGGNSQSIPNFYSSEGTQSYDTRTSNGNGAYNGPDNPNGYLLDAYIIIGNSAASTICSADGYTVMPLSLNRGTGGKDLYLAFTRDPSKVIGHSGSTAPLTGIGAQITDRWDYNGYNDTNDYGDMWSWNCSTQSVNNIVDLNDGAGGRSITPHKRRGGGSPTPNRPIEIGVIRSNAPNPAPPTGWQLCTQTNRAPQDLNEGAGGDYIYFCYKTR